MRVEQGVIIHGQVEVASSLDSMHVARCSARANDRIHPALSKRALAIKVVHGEGA